MTGRFLKVKSRSLNKEQIFVSDTVPEKAAALPHSSNGISTEYSDYTLQQCHRKTCLYFI
jgi:hypothetical protein